MEHPARCTDENLGLQGPSAFRGGWVRVKLTWSKWVVSFPMSGLTGWILRFAKLLVTAMSKTMTTNAVQVAVNGRQKIPKSSRSCEGPLEGLMFSHPWRPAPISLERPTGTGTGGEW